MRLNLSLGGLAALQLAGTFLFQLIVIHLVGVGGETDAWIAAQAVPLVLFSVLSVAAQGAWQSRLAATATEGEEAWLRVQRLGHGQVLMVAGVAIALLAGTSELWIRWLFPGLSELQSAAALRMTRVLLVSSLINAQVALLTTALRARERFIGAEVVVLGGTVAAMALTPLAVPDHGVEAAAWITLARSVGVGLMLFLMAQRPLPSLRGAWRDREGWRQAGPILTSSLYYRSGPLVDRYWSSLAPASGMTLFSLAQTGMAAIAAVLERALCIPYMPRLARLAQQGDLRAMRKTYRISVFRTLLASMGVFVGLVVLYPIWPQIAGSLLKLDAAASMTAWWLCVALIGYLYPAAAGSTVTASFYALGDQRTPARVGVAGFTVSLLLKAVAFKVAGLTGLALATAAHYTGNMLVLCWLLERRLRAERGKPEPVSGGDAS